RHTRFSRDWSSDVCSSDLDIIPHRGPVVATLSADEVRELYVVRGALEALAGEGFARNATDEQVARLREALEYLRQPEASASTEKIGRASCRERGERAGGGA